MNDDSVFVAKLIQSQRINNLRCVFFVCRKVNDQFLGFGLNVPIGIEIEDNFLRILRRKYRICLIKGVCPNRSTFRPRSISAYYFAFIFLGSFSIILPHLASQQHEGSSHHHHLFANNLFQMNFDTIFLQLNRSRPWIRD